MNGPFILITLAWSYTNILLIKHHFEKYFDRKLFLFNSSIHTQLDCKYFICRLNSESSDHVRTRDHMKKMMESIVQMKHKRITDRDLHL